MFRFSLKFCLEKIPILRRMEGDMIINMHWSLRKLQVILGRSESHQNILHRFSRSTQILNFIKIRPVGYELLHADRRTDWHDKVNSRFRHFYLGALLTYLLTYSMEQSPLTGLQLVKNFPTLYGTWRFITAFISDRHQSLSLASSIQSIPPHPTSWRSALTLFSHLHLGLPSDLLPSGFTKAPIYMKSIRRI
jgi:hypothetical protein